MAKPARARHPLIALILLLAVVALGWWLWTAVGVGGPDRAPPLTGQPGPTAPAAGSCALIDDAALAKVDAALFARDSVTDAPRAARGACRVSGAGVALLLRSYDARSLARGDPPLGPAEYFDSIATGLEYEFKAPPDSVPGLGERAVLAGQGSSSAADPMQLAWQRGDRVLVLESRTRISRAQLLAIASAIDAARPQ